MPAAPDAQPRWRVFPPVALGVIMATLDISVVNIALPSLGRAFAVPLPTLEWVVLGYAVTLTGLLLAAGRWADGRGRRRTYGEGLLLFIAASALCAIAPDVRALIAARILQGVGAALVSANGSALLVASFPAAERGRVLGAFGAMVGVGLALGPVLGGLIVSGASWRWIFALNLPVGLLAWILLRARVPEDRPKAQAPPLDVASILLWCGSLALGLLALSRGPVDGWASRSVAGLAAVSLVSLALFTARQLRLASPLLPIARLRGPLGGALSLTLIAHAIGASVGFHLPLYLEGVLGWDAARSGRWFGVLPLAALLIAPIAGRLSDRTGPTRLTTSGLALTAAGLMVLGGLSVHEDVARLALGLALIGVGQGLFAVPNTSVVLSQVPGANLGLASGLQGTARSVGLACGAAVMAAIVATRAHDAGLLHALTFEGREAFAAATRDGYRAAAGVAGAAVLLAWRVGSAAAAPAEPERTDPA